jgi:hypothetical protein
VLAPAYWDAPATNASAAAAATARLANRRS